MEKSCTNRNNNISDYFRSIITSFLIQRVKQIVCFCRCLKALQLIYSGFPKHIITNYTSGTKSQPKVGILDFNFFQLIWVMNFMNYTHLMTKYHSVPNFERLNEFQFNWEWSRKNLSNSKGKDSTLWHLK